MNHVETTIQNSLSLLQSANEIVYDDTDEAYRLQYDPAVDDPSLAVVTAVATILQTAPGDLEPLHGAIDPDALDALCSGDRHQPRITFQYESLEITIDGNSTVECSPPSTETNV